MADRVYFATDEDTTTPANCSGFNGFPFPTTFSAPTTSNPIDVSFEDCIKWWWRVKNWSVLTDAAIVGTDTNAYSLASGDCTPVGGATTENDLVFPGGHEFSLGDGIDSSWIFDLMAFGDKLDFDSGALPPKFYPNIAGTGFVGNSSVGELDFSIFPSFGSSITGIIDGLPIPVYYDATSFPPTSFTFSTLIMTPIEYWPFANSAGLPIWDTATGAQLRDPRS